MKSKLYYFLILICFVGQAYTQEAPNVANVTQLSPNTAAGMQDANATVDYFTGIPSVSISLYSYSEKGMALNISANYIGGGSKDGVEPSIIGKDWYLNAGGLITRTVRGIPDDLPTYGFMNAGVIPTDFRSSGDKYYYDSLDAEPDIFEFNFNGRSGKFYIGKNHQIVVVPLSQLKIQYTTDPTSHLIIAFKITTEDGEKFLFNNTESTTQYVTSGNNYYKSAYSGTMHYSAWYLSQIVSPFNTDTIKFTYTSRYLNTSFAYPATSIVNAGNKGQVAYYNATGTNYSNIIKLSSISFPDLTRISFNYSNVYQYDDTDFALINLKISDSVLRKGYFFLYQRSYSGPITKYDAQHDQDVITTATYPTNLLLSSITPFTSIETSRGYSFAYNTPYPNFHTYEQADSVLTAYDHWGIFNGWNNRADAIPYIQGINTTGSNRYPSPVRNLENSLSNVYFPNGGITHYDYESNVMKPVTIQPQSISLAATTSYNISLSQMFSNLHQLNFNEVNVSRSGAAPFSGTCNLTFNIKSTDGTTLYATTTISMYDLFYLGLKHWTFTVPSNGTYRLESSFSGGGTIPYGYLTQVSWNNKIAGSYSTTIGGIRVAKITSQNASDDTANAMVQEFHYNTSDGNSSSFFGEVPQYYYPYQQNITSPASSTNLYVINSEPVNDLNSSKSFLAAYSHVEVYKGTSTKNLGRTVYDFTNLNDVGANYFYAIFPYGPQYINNWGLGLPKRVVTYDSSNNIIDSKTNQYSFTNTTYNTTDFMGLKLGCSATTYASDPVSNPLTTRVNTYIGEQYYISSGRPSLDQTTDTVFHADGSAQTKSVSYIYDSYYNITKATTTYDRNRGLNLETRLYYPYNYSFTSGAIKTLKDSNIISQVISTEKWITGDANPRIVDATITNFYQLSQKYIVPQHIYKLQTNAPIAQSTIGTFNSSSLVRNSTYFIEQQYMPVFYGNGVAAQETNMISGENSSVIMDYNNQYVIGKVSNAAYSDVAYTSFESDGTGNWTIGSSLRDRTSAMTGIQSFNLSNGDITKTGLNSSLTYIVTVWCKSGAVVSVNGSPISILSNHNGWGLYTKTVSAVTSVTVHGTGLIDELRLYPKDANMFTNTYEPNIGITSTCDVNNTITYNQYDNMNRLKLIRDVDSNILKRYDYTDQAPISLLPNWVGTGTSCITGSYGKYDSVFTDYNTYSFTFGQTTSTYEGTNNCLCTTDPSYRVVNGTCELGTYVVVSSSHYKQPDGTFVWKCVHHYHWSDNYNSSDVTDYHPDSQTSPCYVDY